MKKALAILMIFALVASVAVAEISIGAWGRGLFVPVYSTGADGDTATATNKASWGGNPRIGFTISGGSDNVGFQVDLKADSGKTLDIGDQSKIWVKPVDMLKISLGRVYVDELRGNAAFGSFNWDRDYGDADYGEDFTFTRVMTAPNDRAYDNAQGVVFEVTPVEGVFFAVAFRDVNGEATDNTRFVANPDYDPTDPDSEEFLDAGRTTASLFGNIQIAAGYTIDGIGQIRAQVLRQTIEYKWNSVSAGDIVATGENKKNNDQVEVAFKLTMIENLMVDVGFRMWTDDKVNKSKQVSVYGNYKMDAMTFHLSSRVATELTNHKGKKELGIYAGAGVDYDLGDGIGLGGDIRFENGTMAGSSKDARIKFFAGATKGFSNGLIGAGVEFVNQADTGYSVPVRFEYWF